MIFISTNEKGIPKWQLVMQRRATVTRRFRPEEAGKIKAVQPGRGKKAVGYIRIKSCIPHKDWLYFNNDFFQLDLEAKREGFETWEGLLDWFRKQKVDINETNRLEFELYEKKDEIVC